MLDFNHIELTADSVDRLDDDRRYCFSDWPRWRSEPYGELSYLYYDHSGEGHLEGRGIRFARDEHEPSLTRIEYDGITMELKRGEQRDWILRYACAQEIAIVAQGWRSDRALVRVSEQESYVVRLRMDDSLLGFLAAFGRGIASALSWGRVRRARHLCLFVDRAPEDRGLAARLVVAIAVLRLMYSSADFCVSAG